MNIKFNISGSSSEGNFVTNESRIFLVGSQGHSKSWRIELITVMELLC